MDKISKNRKNNAKSVNKIRFKINNIKSNRIANVGKSAAYFSEKNGELVDRPNFVFEKLHTEKKGTVIFFRKCIKINEMNDTIK